MVVVLTLALGLAFSEAEQPHPLPPALTPTEFEETRERLNPPDQAWSRIHWHSSLSEARRRAVEEEKPLLIRASWGTLHGVC